MDEKALLQELALAGVRLLEMKGAVEAVEPDFGDAPSIYRLQDDAVQRLSLALRDFARTASEIRRVALKRQAEGRADG